jgi:predicted nucleic acid-binding protein
VISHFYDSSSFVKLFVKEDGTTQMLRLYAAANRRFVSRLAFVETQSAIIRLEREGQLSAADADKAGMLLTQEPMGLR